MSDEIKKFTHDNQLLLLFMNEMFNFTFPEDECDRDVLFANVYIFINIYVKLYEIDKPIYNVTDELEKIEEYIMNRELQHSFKSNKLNQNEIYILVSSLIEADTKSKNGEGFLNKFDICLTRNIQHIQRRMNYKMDEIPIVSKILNIISPILDSF